MPMLPPGATVEPLEITVLPLTVPKPLSVWPDAKAKAPPRWPASKLAPPATPATSRTAPEPEAVPTMMLGLLANDPLPVKRSVPAVTVVLPVYVLPGFARTNVPALSLLMAPTPVTAPFQDPVTVGATSTLTPPTKDPTPNAAGMVIELLMDDVARILIVG